MDTSLSGSTTAVQLNCKRANNSDMRERASSNQTFPEFLDPSTMTWGVVVG